MKKIIQQQLYSVLALSMIFVGAFFVAPSEVEACEIEQGSGLRFRTNAGNGGVQPAEWFNESEPPYVYVDIPTIGCEDGETATAYLTLFGMGSVTDDSYLDWLILFPIFFDGDTDNKHILRYSNSVRDYQIQVGQEGKTIALLPDEELCYGGNTDQTSLNQCLIGALFTSHPTTDNESTPLAMIGHYIGPISINQAENFANLYGDSLQPSSTCAPFNNGFASVSASCETVFSGWRTGVTWITMQRIIDYYNAGGGMDYQIVTDEDTPAALLGFPGLAFDCDGFCAFNDPWQVAPNGYNLPYGTNHNNDEVLINPFSDSYEENYTPLAPLPFEGLNGGESGDLGDYFAAIFRTLIVILVILAVLMLVFYGFAHIVVDSVSKKDTFRDKTWNILYALLLALGAWLLLNTISPNLASDLKLTLPTVSLDGYEYSEDGVAVIPSGCPKPEILPASCTACQTIASNINMSPSSNNQITASMNTRLQNLQEILSTNQINWRITEAFPATVNHCSKCHYRGTCVDANFVSPSQPNLESIQAFIQASEDAGLRAVYETNNLDFYTTLKEAGIPLSKKATSTGNLLYLENITAPHFSVYN